MEAFLRKRGVTESTLKLLRDQKIDEESVNGMTDMDLSEYLPKKGDRFALRDFLGQGKKPKSNKASLMDRLKQRLQRPNTSSADSFTEEQEAPVKKMQKLSAKKEVHKVHLGWYHFDETKKVYLHVRAKAGGGKRTLLLNKNMDKQSIIKECLDLFYPNGRSQHGQLKDMIVELTDFQLKPLDDEETTLGDIIDKAKLQFIHFYLRTRLIKPPVLDDLDGNNGDNTQEDKLNDTTTKTNVDAMSSEGSACAGDSSPLPDPFIPVWEDSFNEVAFTHIEPIHITKPVREPKDFKIVVHRGQVFRELISIFKDTCNHDLDFTKDIISAAIVLPNGDQEQAYDSGGVLRDVLTEFWEDFYETCTTGTSMRVPCLRHDMEASDWKAVGRIIALGWTVQKILPARLAPNFLKSSMYGISGPGLRDEFFQFIPQSESNLLLKALENFEEVDMDDLLEILSNHECKVSVTKDNLGAVIDQIAHMEMVQEPAFIRECFFEVLISYEMVMDVEAEFKKITPTSKKMISALVCEESESSSFKFLKRYIREIDTEERVLRNLLRFLTASDLMLYDSEGYFKITVKIVDLDGIGRRPVAHTCGRILDLPRAYESYAVFKSELNAVLNSNVWVMDFA